MQWYVNDVGVELRFTVFENDEDGHEQIRDLEGATVDLLVDGDPTIRSCVIIEPTINGRANYTTVLNDFTAGNKTAQLRITTLTNEIFNSNVFLFTVSACVNPNA